MKPQPRMVARMMEEGVGPVILSMPPGRFEARELAFPSGAARRVMRVLNAEGVVDRVGTHHGGAAVWVRGVNFESWREAIERVSQ